MARAEDRAEAPHERVGRYLVLELAGQGAMGRVLRAYDPKLKREVALKLVRGAHDAAQRERLVAEAQAMARLSHPNIVAVYDVELTDAAPFIVMEYVDGTTLSEWIESGPYPAEEVLDAFRRAGKGLAAAHAAGIVHRDFKPHNVMRRVDGRIQVMDFGIATPSTEGAAASAGETDGIAGTPAYMSPEQHAGQAADTRSDQYAFCVALWEALAGVRPFGGKDLESAKRTSEPREAREGWTMPRAIRDVLLRGLSVDPAHRYPSQEALLEALSPSPKRFRWILIGSLIGIAGLGATQFYGWRSRVAARERCQLAGQALAGSWNDDARQRLQNAFAESGAHNADAVFAKTVPWIDDYAAKWQEARTRHCLAVEVDGTPPALHLETDACFDERRASVAATLEVLAAADTRVVQRAVKAVAGFPRIDACTDEVALRQRPTPPSDPDEAKALAELRRARAGVLALVAAGQVAKANTSAQAALEAARELNWGPAIVDALLDLAEILEMASDYEASAKAAEEAFNLALGAGYDAGALSATGRLVYVVGYGLSRPDDGLRWSTTGMALARRLGYPLEHPRRLGLLNNTAVVHWVRGEYAEAQRLHLEILATKRREFGDAHLTLTSTLGNLAITYAMNGEFDQADAVLSESLEITTSVLGEDHPSVAAILTKLGSVASSRGETEQAQAHFERSLKLTERALGENHTDVALVLVNLSLERLGGGDLEGALEATERAEQIVVATGDARHPFLPGIFSALGRIHQAKGELQLARNDFEKALELRRESLPAEHPETVANAEALAAVENELAAGHHD